MSVFALDRFEIDARTGFLPPEPPLQRLGPAYHVWEELLDHGKVNARTLRDHLGVIPPIPSVLAAWKDWRDRVSVVRLFPFRTLFDLLTSLCLDACHPDVRPRGRR